ncbi:MAG: divalent-cation tolerance protein CutA, partial [Candidatus Zixiibacteriota bacterium]
LSARSIFLDPEERVGDTPRQILRTMNSLVSVTLITCPSQDAEKIARALVEECLAACVNIIPQALSVYRWENKIESDSESILIVKSTSERHEELSRRVMELHPYSCPEIIALPVSEGLESYLSWVVGETEARRDDAGKER